MIFLFFKIKSQYLKQRFLKALLKYDEASQVVIDYRKSGRVSNYKVRQ